MRWTQTSQLDREYVFIFETYTEHLNEEILHKPQRIERSEGYSLSKINFNSKLMLKRQPKPLQLSGN